MTTNIQSDNNSKTSSGEETRSSLVQNELTRSITTKYEVILILIHEQNTKTGCNFPIKTGLKSCHLSSLIISYGYHVVNLPIIHQLFIFDYNNIAYLTNVQDIYIYISTFLVDSETINCYLQALITWDYLLTVASFNTRFKWIKNMHTFFLPSLTIITYQKSSSP